VIAAVATPPDVISQLMLAVPLILLFEGALIVMHFTEKRAASKATDEEPKAPVSAE
jgi:sec-independent protein translocase protein TatC